MEIQDKQQTADAFITLRVPKYVRQTLEKLAIEDARPLSNYVRQVLLRYVNQVEVDKKK